MAAASLAPKTGVELMPAVKNQPLRSQDENRLYRRRCRVSCRILLPERSSRPKQAGLCGTDEIMADCPAL